MPELVIDNEFNEICQQIIAEGKSLAQWGEIESDDMFQSKQYCGGYDGTEKEFTFSYFAPEGQEWWFQITLDDIQNVIDGKLNTINIKVADI